MSLFCCLGEVCKFAWFVSLRVTIYRLPRFANENVKVTAWTPKLPGQSTHFLLYSKLGQVVIIDISKTSNYIGIKCINVE